MAPPKKKTNQMRQKDKKITRSRPLDKEKEERSRKKMKSFHDENGLVLRSGRTLFRFGFVLRSGRILPKFLPKPKQSPSSKTNTLFFTCEICVETKPLNKCFNVKGCPHSYCNDCTIKFVASKLHENLTNITCPVSICKGTLDLEYCRAILPPYVFDKWENGLSESVIDEFPKFYCPFKDCSVLLLASDDCQAALTKSECPYCHRMFCVQCKVSWHDGIECGEFQKLNENEREREDIMLVELANKRRWKRCPHCRFYVEKIRGCSEVMCRCGRVFNYSA